MHVFLINVRRIYVCIWREECMPMCLQSHLLSFSCHYLATSLPKDNIYSSLVNIRQINFMYWSNMSMKLVWLNCIKAAETDIVYTTDVSLVSKFSWGKIPLGKRNQNIRMKYTGSQEFPLQFLGSPQKWTIKKQSLFFNPVGCSTSSKVYIILKTRYKMPTDCSWMHHRYRTLLQKVSLSLTWFTGLKTHCFKIFISLQ